MAVATKTRKKVPKRDAWNHPDPVWISSSEAARIIGINPRYIPDLARQGKLTQRRVPGISALPRYLRSDVEKIARESIIPAK
jgi:hypothetical protein